MPIWIAVFSSVAASAIVGMVSSYLTAQKTIASMGARVAQNEKEIKQLIDARQKFESEVSDRFQEITRSFDGVRDSITRLDTKMDLLLGNRIKFEE